MDWIKNLQNLGFGSRLKRLSDQIMNSANEVYKELGIDFESRWFVTFNLLYKSEKPLSISELAKALGFSHPAVIKITNILIKKELIVSMKDNSDERKHLLQLSDRGKKLANELDPLWTQFKISTNELLDEIEIDMNMVFAKFEEALSRKSLSMRIVDNYKNYLLSNITIRRYSPEYNQYFKSLNIQWLEKYFKVEETDLVLLDNPKMIIDNSGMILFAEYENMIVGTAAIVKITSDKAEICKMAVFEDYQGKQIGKKLLTEIINYCKAANFQEIVLTTDEKLYKAISLYRSFGFKICEKSEANLKGYEREKSCIAMKITLRNNDEN
ncbi:MAG: bifunctional helix-turn-helix transcriptional regulator/GNAT family N-acetyltransferase [Candidatus Delongbacteria bacterium]|nr:bifunctional helix-turn-helix transcriptional regulator/GNAT family N-acetyltransferase [Candidatus Delongbacteria bacterium]MBN2835555.1 bifunctional helix-turn-helix transcriptional regulator/GNAT family N-acetyltransferase [Candidatus Delongbacteria bacterium]